MLAFFVSCMLLFDPEMLGAKFSSGGVPMLGLAVVVGLIGGAWIGRDLRKELAKHKSRRHLGELFPRVGFVVTNLRRSPKRVVKFYNGRGTAEQRIKEGKNALKWTRLSCRRFKDNQARLQLFALAYNLGNFLRQLALPRPVRTYIFRKRCSATTRSSAPSSWRRRSNRSAMAKPSWKAS